MKIIAILNSTLGAGGGYDQALNAILQMNRICSNRFEFEVFTTDQKNITYLDRIHIPSTFFRLSKTDQWMMKFAQNELWILFQKKMKLISPLEKKLLKHQCDIAYFVTPNELPSCFQKINYINTLWDLAHREHPEFPEVRNDNVFQSRDSSLRKTLGPALLTITDSVTLSNLASSLYCIDQSRFLAMPFAPSPFIEDQQTMNKDLVSKKYGLEAGYFYYPAQFWSHKNHIRLLQALSILRDQQNWKPTLVFSGKDYGNLSHVKDCIKKLDLTSQVKILGFVPSEEIRGLYENALAVVMPTYFGPTNLPPLEAWSVGTPLLYSEHLKEQTGDAAILFDPDQATQIATAMQLVMEPQLRKQLIQAGYERLKLINTQRSEAENQLYRILQRFELRRECWNH